MKPAAEDDDFLPGLPPIDGGGDDGEPEIELANEIDGDDEDVGLDTETGPTEGLAPEDLLDDLEDENERTNAEDWRVEGEPIGELEGEGQLVDPAGGEYGWTDDSEATSLDEPDDIIARIPDTEAVLGSDSGEEGVEDDADPLNLGQDDARNLPPLEPIVPDDETSDTEDEDAWLEPWSADLEQDQELEQSGLAVGQLEPGPLVAHYFGPPDDALLTVAATPTCVLAAGDSFYELRSGALVAMRPFSLDGDTIVSIGVHPRLPSHIVLGTRLGRIWCSRDRGATFVPAKSLHDPPDTGAACYVALEAADGIERLWVRTRSGALFRSEDYGVSFVGPLVPFVVSAVHADPTGGVVALCVSHQGAAQIARTHDGGRRWEMRDVPFFGGGESEAPYGLAVYGGAIAITKDGSIEAPLVSFDDGRHWDRLPGLSRSGPVLLLEESDGIALYAGIFFEASDRGFVMRRVHDEETAVLDVARERSEKSIELRGDSDGDNRVFALAGAYHDDGVVIYAATSAGLFQLRSSDAEQEP